MNKKEKRYASQEEFDLDKWKLYLLNISIIITFIMVITILIGIILEALNHAHPVMAAVVLGGMLGMFGFVFMIEFTDGWKMRHW